MQRARLLHIILINVMKSRSSYARGGFFIAARCVYCRKRTVNSITATITKQNVRSSIQLTYIAAPFYERSSPLVRARKCSVIQRDFQPNRARSIRPNCYVKGE
jgi:hypothetical protein